MCMPPENAMYMRAFHAHQLRLAKFMTRRVCWTRSVFQCEWTPRTMSYATIHHKQWWWLQSTSSVGPRLTVCPNASRPAGVRGYASVGLEVSIPPLTAAREHALAAHLNAWAGVSEEVDCDAGHCPRVTPASITKLKALAQ
jgi:hypothetical protein